MELQQAKMQMTCADKTVPKFVLLWKEVGLCIHRHSSMYGMLWRISHFNSGRSVLTNIKKKEQAIKYMCSLQGIMEKWDFLLDEFDAWKMQNPEESKKVKEYVDTLQKQIYGVKNEACAEKEK